MANRVVFTCAAGAAPAAATPAAAERGDISRPFGVALPSTGIAPGFGGPLAPLFAWVADQQRMVYRGLADTVRAFRNDPSAGWLLIGMSFVYGLLHAAGPGHGKAGDFVLCPGQSRDRPARRRPGLSRRLRAGRGGADRGRAS